MFRNACLVGIALATSTYACATGTDSLFAQGGARSGSSSDTTSAGLLVERDHSITSGATSGVTTGATTSGATTGG
jgi:hypothetical protein